MNIDSQEPSLSTIAPSVRSAKDGPFCWQSKSARRKIRDAFDATNDVASALGVYDALTEIASDEQSETFKTAHAWIARMSGVSARTIQGRLKVFVELGLVAISTPKLREKSTYIMLTLSNGCASTGNQCATFGNESKQVTLPRYEESKKNQRTNRKNHSAAVPAPALPTLKPRDELFDALAESCGSNPHEMTARALRACGVALAEIRRACPNVQASDFAIRATGYRRQYRDAALTPSALCSHWAEFSGIAKQQPTQSTQTPEPHSRWNEIMHKHFGDAAILAGDRPWSARTPADQATLAKAWLDIPEDERTI
jgi:hypothetical protein